MIITFVYLHMNKNEKENKREEKISSAPVCISEYSAEPSAEY